MALTAYKILTANSPENLSDAVMAAAASGWLPLGAPTIDPNDGAYAQAVVKGDVAGAPGTGDVYELPEASAEAIGGVKKAAAVEDATSETLLAAMRAAGQAEEPETEA